ncbi:MAG: endonuclease V [Phaeodactylibacter sp.]|nr:endonuclease V [Phaeodactylibacter sp.]
MKEQWAAIQERLRRRLDIPAEGAGYRPVAGDCFVALDIQYAGEEGFVAMAVGHWAQPGTAVFVSRQQVDQPYIPGYFSFREGPLLQRALEQLGAEKQIHPQLLIVDGHGTAHPRKMGIACWLGLQLDTPAIGVAKEPLMKQPYTLAEEKGSTHPVLLDEEIVGCVLRTRTGVKPVFVSSGHRVAQQEAVRIALALTGPYRIIEPIRQADQAARAFQRGGVEGFSSL